MSYPVLGSWQDRYLLLVDYKQDGALVSGSNFQNWTPMGIPIVARWLVNPTSIHEDEVPSPASLSGLRIPGCCELGCRSQMCLGSRVAVAVFQASSFSSYWTPSLETSICHRCGPEKTKRPKKKKKNWTPMWFSLCQGWLIFFSVVRFLLPSVTSSQKQIFRHP